MNRLWEVVGKGTNNLASHLEQSAALVREPDYTVNPETHDLLNQVECHSLHFINLCREIMLDDH